MQNQTENISALVCAQQLGVCGSSAGLQLPARDPREAELIKTYESLDADKSGSLTSMDFVLHMYSLGLEAALSDSQKFMQQLDRNHDGHISFAEYKAQPHPEDMFRVGLQRPDWKGQAAPDSSQSSVGGASVHAPNRVTGSEPAATRSRSPPLLGGAMRGVSLLSVSGALLAVAGVALVWTSRARFSTDL